MSSSVDINNSKVTSLTFVAAQFGLPMPVVSTDDNHNEVTTVPLDSIMLCSLAPAPGHSGANRRLGALSTTRQHHTGAIHVNAVDASATPPLATAPSSSSSTPTPPAPAPYTHTNKGLSPVDYGVVVPVVATLVLPHNDSNRNMEANMYNNKSSKSKSSYSTILPPLKSGLYIHSVRNHVLEKRPSYNSYLPTTSTSSSPDDQHAPTVQTVQEQVMQAASRATHMMRNVDGKITVPNLNSWGKKMALKQYEKSAKSLDGIKKKIKDAVKSKNMELISGLQSIYRSEAVKQEEDSTYFEPICFVSLSELINVESEGDRVDRLYRVLNYDAFDSCLNTKLFGVVGDGDGKNKKSATATNATLSAADQKLPYTLGAGLLPRLRHMLAKMESSSVSEDLTSPATATTITTPPLQFTGTATCPPVCSCVLRNSHSWFGDNFEVVPHTSAMQADLPASAVPMVSSSSSKKMTQSSSSATSTTCPPPQPFCQCECRFCKQYPSASTSVIGRPLFSENNWEEWWATYAPHHARDIFRSRSAGGKTTNAIRGESGTSPLVHLNASFDSNVTAIELLASGGAMMGSYDDSGNVMAGSPHSRSSPPPSTNINGAATHPHNTHASLLVCKNSLAFPPLSVIGTTSSSSSTTTTSSSSSSKSHSRIFIHFNDSTATSEEKADVQQLVLFVPETSSLIHHQSDDDENGDCADHHSVGPFISTDFVSTMVQAIYQCPQFMAGLDALSTPTSTTTTTKKKMTPFLLSRAVEKRVTAFVSPMSGQGLAVKTWQQVMFPILRVSRFRCRAIITERVKHAEDIVAGCKFTPTFPRKSSSSNPQQPPKIMAPDDEESRLFPLVFPPHVTATALPLLTTPSPGNNNDGGDDVHGGGGLGPNDVLIAVGGDGMIFEVFNGVARRFDYINLPTREAPPGTTMNGGVDGKEQLSIGASSSSSSAPPAATTARGPWEDVPREDANLQYIVPPSLLSRIPTIGVIAAGSGCGIAKVLEVLEIAKATLAVIHHRVAVTSLIRVDPTDMPKSALHGPTADRHGVTRTSADDKETDGRNQQHGSERATIDQSQGVRFVCMDVSFAVTNEVDQGSENWRWMGNARFTVKVGQLLLQSVPDYLMHIKYAKYNPSLHSNRNQITTASNATGGCNSSNENGWANIKEKRLLFCMVMSMSHIARDVVMAPDADPNDGCLELCILDSGKSGSAPTEEALNKIRDARRALHASAASSTQSPSHFLSDDETAAEVSTTTSTNNTKSKKSGSLGRSELLNFFIETDDGSHVHNPRVQYIKTNRVQIMPVDGTIMADGEVLPKTGVVLSQVVNAIKFIKGDQCQW